ncbi:hypothetical protein B0T16DRAFT_402570 [Cercophora newfieldiana]|uniref:C2H2-type domain-containing protein n=1 Tax=Cercophora newfieldiana TaxID=92897 RepID=A0AA40D246_9PEZI|nr:hypothetical protein B0T16DRAFT_402570 [Cercophora newfieldiana]
MATQPPKTQPDEYFADEDYLPSGSPGLQPIKVNWYEDGVPGASRQLSGAWNADDEELDFDSPWVSELAPRFLKARMSQNDDDTDSRRGRNYQVTRALLNLMGSGRNWSLSDPGPEDFAIKWRPLPGEDLNIPDPIYPEPSDTPRPEFPGVPLIKPVVPPESSPSSPPISPHSSWTTISKQLTNRRPILDSPIDSLSSSLYSPPSPRGLPPIHVVGPREAWSPLPSINEFPSMPPPLLDQFQAGRSLIRPYSSSDPNDKAKITAPPPAAARARTRPKERKRWGLPIIIDGQGGSITVTASPDTGSDESIIPFELASRLGLEVKVVDEKEMFFALANGKVVKSLGVADIRCSFGAQSPAASGPPETMEFMVHVFESLAVPAILGAAFLEETETFTKHRDRLVEELVPSMQSLRVCSVGKPKRGLVCRLDTFIGCATADTGSDMDLVSPQFVQQRGLKVRDGDIELLEFADGSTGETRGSIDISFAIGNVHDVHGFVPRGNVLDLEFFVLDNLTSDILVGRDTLEELKVPSENGDLIIDSMPPPGLSDCNIIRHIGTVESTVKSALKRIKSVFTWPDSPRSTFVNTGYNDSEDELTAIQRRNAQLESESLGSLYVCRFQGCTAPPFATQYLLNAHANVHSSARPHYCPVKSCPRSEGGKGFKRKNEMIRHGLVHDCPGYVCPFCPDREHKYPRPDNLQRHVRVHHVDKDKDDPCLRDVLAQRPDGPNKGRRRRGIQG